MKIKTANKSQTCMGTARKATQEDISQITSNLKKLTEEETVIRYMTVIRLPICLD